MNQALVQDVVSEVMKRLGNRALSEMQALEEHAVLATDGVSDDLAPGDLVVDRRPDQVSVHFEQPLRETGQLLDGQTAVAFIHGGLERERNARAKPLWRGDQAEINFSLASGVASRKVCMGVLPKHQRP